MPSPDPNHTTDLPAQQRDMEPAVTTDWSRLDSSLDPNATGAYATQSRGSSGSADGGQAGGVLATIPGYVIEGILGRGGMGVVYRARQTDLNRPVAIKMILGGKYTDPVAQARFLVEAEVIAAIQSPHIVQVFEFGRCDDQPYFVLEFVSGGSLAGRLKKGGPLSPRDAAVLVAKLADAMAAAHQKGVVHRDLKPANVLLTEGGEPKVTDFGLAKTGLSDMTATGAVMGTPRYMSPEQAAGKTKEVGTPTDVYALGAILYESLTGRPPFAGDSEMATIQQVLTREPTRPRLIEAKVPRDLETICLKCLAKLPVKRYATASELSADLRAFLEGRPITARPVGNLELTWKWAKRSPGRAAALAAVVVVLVGAVIAANEVRNQREADRLAAEKQRADDRISYEEKRLADLRAADARATADLKAADEKAREKQRTTRAESLVQALSTADTAEVPRIVSDLADLRDLARPRLLELATQAITTKPGLHARLALLTDDPGLAANVAEYLPKSNLEELVTIRVLLKPHAATITLPLWAVLSDEKSDSGQRVRAAGVLAGLAPDDPRWKQASGDVATALVNQDSFVIARWTAVLKPVGRWLIPPLADFLVDEKRSLSARSVIAKMYATFATNVPDAFTRLETQLATASDPRATADAKIAFAKRQASIGAALLVLGRDEKVWPLLQHRPDSTLRSYLIERLVSIGVDPKMLVVRLAEEKDEAVRRALLLGLGDYGPGRLAPVEREKVLALYRDDPDAGVHGAAEWALREWGASAELNKADLELVTRKLAGNRQWYVTGQGQTMTLVLKPGEFWLGDVTLYGSRQRCRIERSFAIATKDVTVEQFLRFRKDHRYDKQLAPTGDCPVNSVQWYDAAAYCNWLSEQEGLPRDQWCYVPNNDGKYADGMTMAPGYLKRTGYRLPREAEWEYACRAGSDTGWSFGESEELLGRYGWFNLNGREKSHPVGLLRPNDLGLFDMHGNIGNWCQDVWRQDGNPMGGMAIIDEDDINDVKSKDKRTLRGATFGASPTHVRSAYRNGMPLTIRFLISGFRPSRTIIH